MNQSKQVIVGLAAAIIMSSAGAVPALGGILFSVGDFDSWTTHAVHAPNANSTQTYFASSTGGNPGGMFTAYSTRADTHTVESAHIYEDQLTLSPLWGTFDLAFQYQRAAAADNGGYSTGLAIRQGSSYWGVGYNQVFDSVPWSNGSLQGAFESQNFGALYGTTGSPVLTGGVPTYFGFYTGRVGPVDGVWGDNFDNLFLLAENEIVMQPVPEPASLGLIGAIGTIALRRSRKN